jgi:3'(2'), 5'-bisphosphate nucleotidase
MIQNIYDPADCNRLLEAVHLLVIEAGDEILRVYEKGFDIAQKVDMSPVTTADLASHQIIKHGLGRLTPLLPLVSEEEEHLPYEIRSTWPSYWLIDPLDGTREFIKRNDEFSINIALIHHHEPVLGVVYSPVERLCYYACRGMGAYRQIGDAAAVRIHTRETPTHRPTVVGSRSHAGPLFQAFIQKLGPHELRRRGSALKSCMVAEGSADIYPRFGPTSEWDTAAAQCVVVEAGGLLTDMRMKVIRYNTKTSLENPPFVVFGDQEYGWSDYL